MSFQLSKETVIKLCDAGYPTQVFSRTVYNGSEYDMLMPGRNEDDIVYSDAVADWLRSKGLHILVATNIDHDGWISGIQSKKQYEPIEVIDEDNACKDHDLALSAAITRALEILATNK